MTFVSAQMKGLEPMFEIKNKTKTRSRKKAPQILETTSELHLGLEDSLVFDKSDYVDVPIDHSSF